MYVLRGVKTLTLVKNASQVVILLIEIRCVAGLFRVVMMSCILGNDTSSVNAFYFVGYSQPVSWCFVSQKLTSI
jgi:hypothetical protein